ncbi:LysE family translocator [Thalassomonas viridans]|uniref:LysE family translocator n=1 Tax=Thalassomonas viridans TaxID=137584 RepID=A0AAE9ZCV1_9GAMM|nr:LysE family translocator [Thalassomonas viridans]WDE08462.1 LysE family translocator [Thalassomonas viridans]
MFLEQLFPLISFAFVMSVSPGPGNFLLLASGANFGLVRTTPLILGISFGFLTMVLLVGLGLGELFKVFPAVSLVLKAACLLYVVWLGIKLARSTSMGDENKASLNRPISFVQAAMLQWLNPKAWTVSLIVTVTYTSTDTSTESFFASLLSTIFIFALVNIPTISFWAIGGAYLKQFLSTDNRIKYFNMAMSILLIGSMAPMIINS